MISIEKLRYVRLGVADLRKTADFATRIIGLQPVESADGTAMFRSDYRDHTLVLYENDVPEQTVAVEVRSEQIFDTAALRLREAGYAVTAGDAALCKARRVKAIVSFRVRDGVTIELVVRPLHSGWRYFPSRDAGITEFFGVAFASTDVPPMFACGLRSSTGGSRLRRRRSLYQHRRRSIIGSPCTLRPRTGFWKSSSASRACTN